MKAFTAPETVPVKCEGPRVFLAGSIEQGKATDWQAGVIDSLKHLPCTILNPRRASWDATWVQDMTNPRFVEQVNWEHDQLEAADIVFFYFQGDTLSPITLQELGMILMLKDHSASYVGVVVVVEPAFWRLGNIQVSCERSNIRPIYNLAAGIDHLIEVVTRFHTGH